MSNMKTCNCDPKFRRVQIRNGNYSAFESPKYQFHPSDYSLIRCMKCGWVFRSNAKWVEQCKDISDEEMKQLETMKIHPNVTPTRSKRRAIRL